MSRPPESIVHIDVVRFDRLFDVQASNGNFSFESGGRRRFAVELAGGEIPAEGARYAVALAEKDNWQKIVGWRDLAGTEVRLRESAWDAALSGLHAWCMLAPLLVIFVLLSLGPWAALAAFLALFWLWVQMIGRALRRNRLVDEALRAVDPPAPPGRGGVPPSARVRLGGIITSIFTTIVSG